MCPNIRREISPLNYLLGEAVISGAFVDEKIVASDTDDTSWITSNLASDGLFIPFFSLDMSIPASEASASVTTNTGPPPKSFVVSLWIFPPPAEESPA